MVGLRVLDIGDLGPLCPASALAWRLVWPGWPGCRLWPGVAWSRAD